MWANYIELKVIGFYSATDRDACKENAPRPVLNA
jgi:hypothetical protein